jgi:hypothetical protein
MIQPSKTELIHALRTHRLRVVRHQAFLPNNPRDVPRVNDRRILNGIPMGLALRRTVARPAQKLRASFAGGGLAYGASSGLRLLPLTIPPSK